MLPTPLPVSIEEEKGDCPPLGLMYIASNARKNLSCQIEILDAEVEELTYPQVEDEIRHRKPDVVGIQVMTFTLIDALITAEIVKKVDKNIIVVLGGPHIWLFPKETLQMKSVDYIVIGEGELIFTELLEALQEGKDISSIDGIGYKNNGDLKINHIRDFIKNLDAIPFPARDLTSFKKYTTAVARRAPITTMITSRGCPFKCLFCDRPHLGKMFRFRSPKNVVDEMEECIKMGIFEYLIYDDTFTINKQRVIGICDEIISRKLNIGWDVRARIDTVDLPLLIKMKEAGCERIHYGVESGSPRILKILRKDVNLDKVRRIFKETKEAGISTLAYFMLGNPSETREEIMQSIRFSRELNADYVHFSVTTPYPGTDLYYMGIQKGIFGDFWKEFANNPTKEFRPVLWEEILKRDELDDLLIKAYKGFYLRPAYILKSIFKTRSITEFANKAKGALRVIKLK